MWVVLMLPKPLSTLQSSVGTAVSARDVKRSCITVNSSAGTISVVGEADIILLAEELLTELQ